MGAPCGRIFAKGFEKGEKLLQKFFATPPAGDKAGITLEPAFKIYKADSEKLIEEDIAGDFGNIFLNEISHFVDCIRNDKTPSSNIEQSVQLQMMLMGIYESSKTGHEVVFEY